MNTRQLLGLIFSIVQIHSLSAGSFNQRWGANSHITNLPLFFQNRIYNDRYPDEKDCNCPAKYITQQPGERNEYQVKAMQQKQLKMQEQQKTLTRKKNKLNKKIAEIQQKEYELTHGYKKTEQLEING